jgi:FKBP-type peptidyl-prolyl cis-trans isomerase FklB
MKIYTIKWMMAAAVGLMAIQGQAQVATALKSPQEKDSYAIGADLARNLKKQGVQVETEALLRGMRDGFSGGKMAMTDEQIRETLLAYQNELRRKVVAGRGGTLPVAEENQAKGAAFLAENKTQAGVVTLPSGLQYKILKAGTGRKPAVTDTVECHHRCSFIDGTEYNSTYRTGTPASLKVGEGIAAWKEALPLMPVGSKWQLFVPPHLAFGERGVVDGRGRPRIAPNATLIYEVELLAIK